ncbi:hypothetical protein B2G51_12550 [Leptospira santarosai]|uniref:Uncharacterized protein n=2 Tax=Leptospira santarosai TaxID=28183 RepID=A0AB73NCK7_9LEPT|nr:hypothetical protein LSS_21255 [Leptospira santarosai serovar Shermani str. LT 821]ASV12377.1 hypothetical protein B2G51_12550 [Leptospira santarosai]ONF91364.1 hypothetical protein BWD14_17375 [Leptospira santarosai]
MKPRLDSEFEPLRGKLLELITYNVSQHSILSYRKAQTARTQNFALYGSLGKNLYFVFHRSQSSVPPRLWIGFL